MNQNYKKIREKLHFFYFQNCSFFIANAQRSKNIFKDKIDNSKQPDKDLDACLKTNSIELF
jgi:hypothetical protein